MVEMAAAQTRPPHSAPFRAPVHLLRLTDNAPSSRLLARKFTHLPIESSEGSACTQMRKHAARVQLVKRKTFYSPALLELLFYRADREESS